MNSLIFKATAYAVTAHDGQYRDSATGKKTPFVVHTLRVAAALVDHGVTDEVTIAAAILHDTLEDTRTGYGELVREFGADVANVVAELTDTPGLSSLEAKRVQIAKGPKMSWRAQLVKIGDKTDNVRSSTDAPWKIESKLGYMKSAAKVVDACGSDNAANMALTATFVATLKEIRAEIA